MNNNLLGILQQIVNEHGEDILNNPKRVRGLLADMAPREPKTEKKALVKCFEMGFYTELKDTDEPGPQKIMLVERLRNSEGFVTELCEGSVDIIAVLAETHLPKSETPKDERTAETVSNVSESIETEYDYKLIAQGYLSAIEIKDDEIDLLKFKNNEVKETLKKRNNEIRKMEDEKNELQRQFRKTEDTKIELQEQYDQMKGYKSGVVAFLVIVLLIAAGVGISQYYNLRDNYVSREIYTLSKSDYSDLKIERDALQTTYNNSKKIWVINITGMKVGNANQSNKWITEPGVQLNASAVRYLNPVFTYDSKTSGWLTFYIKIIDSSGKLKTGSTSPSGFTYSYSRQISQGESLSLDPMGYGNETSSSYSAGTYTIELWYEGFCLYSGTTTLN